MLFYEKAEGMGISIVFVPVRLFHESVGSAGVHTSQRGKVSAVRDPERWDRGMLGQRGGDR